MADILANLGVSRRRGANVRICIGLRGGDMQRRGQSGLPTKVQRGGPKARKAPSTHVSGADFPAFIVIDDKGNDVFKDINLG